MVNLSFDCVLALCTSVFTAFMQAGTSGIVSESFQGDGSLFDVLCSAGDCSFCQKQCASAPAITNKVSLILYPVVCACLLLSACSWCSSSSLSEHNCLRALDTV